jgi:hypothetical protein
MQLVGYSVFTLTENKVKWRKDVKIMSVWFRIKETSLKYRIFMSSCKMRNELETKRNKSKRNLPHFVSVNFVSLRFISFRFVSHFTGTPIDEISKEGKQTIISSVKVWHDKPLGDIIFLWETICHITLLQGWKLYIV